MKLNPKIGVLGLWHLGSVISASWSKLGFDVICYDYDEEILNLYRKNKIPVYEPGLEILINESIDKKKITIASNIKEFFDCDFIFLTYDTPINNQDISNVEILINSINDLGRVMKNESCIIISSQSPVGICDSLRKKLIKINPSIELAYSPENLQLGNAMDGYLEPGRIILGTHNKKTEKLCKKLFQNICDNIISMNLESAELVKHGINSFLAMSIVFIDQLSDICEENNADIKSVVNGIKSDDRIGEKAYLNPGIGFSGGTLGRDLQVLQSKTNINEYPNANIFKSVYGQNKRRKSIIVSKIEKKLFSLKGKNIGILGVTYKPGTSTLRRSLPIEICKLLLKKGANIRVYDPKANFSDLDIKVEVKKNIISLSNNIDILILLTEWKEFLKFDWTSILLNMRENYFYDPKRFLSTGKLKKAGFDYFT